MSYMMNYDDYYNGNQGRQRTGSITRGTVNRGAQVGVNPVGTLGAVPNERLNIDDYINALIAMRSR